MILHPIPVSRLVIHLASFLGVLIGLTFTFALIVVFQTAYETDPPLEFEQGRAVAFSDEDGTVVLYLRPFTAKKSGDVMLERSVDCTFFGGEAVFDIPPFMRYYAKGEHVAKQRVILHTASIPVGTQCRLITEIVWRPLFSMRWHSQSLEPIHFTVAKKGDFRAFEGAGL